MMKVEEILKKTDSKFSRLRPREFERVLLRRDLTRDILIEKINSAVIYHPTIYEKLPEIRASDLTDEATALYDFIKKENPDSPDSSYLTMFKSVFLPTVLELDLNQRRVVKAMLGFLSRYVYY